MRTQKQIEATRANGRKSRGPVTAEGKAIAAPNSLKHGLTAATTTVDARLAHHIERHLGIVATEYPLTNPRQLAAARALATARAHESRIHELEHTVLNDEVETQRAASPEGENARRSMLPFQAYFSDALGARFVHLLADYESRALRMQFRAENYLGKTCSTSAGMKTNPAKSLKSQPRAADPEKPFSNSHDA